MLWTRTHHDRPEVAQQSEGAQVFTWRRDGWDLDWFWVSLWTGEGAISWANGGAARVYARAPSKQEVHNNQELWLDNRVIIRATLTAGRVPHTQSFQLHKFCVCMFRQKGYRPPQKIPKSLNSLNFLPSLSTSNTHIYNYNMRSPEVSKVH